MSNHDRLGEDRGQTAAEVLGAIVVLLAMLGSVNAGALGQGAADRIGSVLCRIAGQAGTCDVATPAPSSPAIPTGLDGSQPVDPALVAQAAHRLRDLATEGDPSAIRNFVDSLDPALLDALLSAEPDLLGTTDGVPPPIRYIANAGRLEAAAIDLRAAADLLDADRPLVELPGIGPSIDERVASLRAAADQLAAMADPAAQVLDFEPGPPGRPLDGRLSQVLGDLEGASHLGIVVPGVGTDLSTFGDPARGEGLAGDAQAVLDAARTHDPTADVAVIAHLGYDPPESLLSVATASGARATGSVAENVAFGDGLAQANPDAHVTVIGHSYGSRAASEWIQGGMDVDQVAFIGSPGTGVDTAAELGVDDVYVATAPDDPIRLVPGLVHGPDPTDEDYGGTPFTIGGASGHSGYTDPGTDSVANLGLIVLDRDHDVTTP